MVKQCRVFLSYSHHDGAVAAAIAKGLSRAGAEVAAAFDIQPGESVRDSLEQMLRASDVYVILVTPALVNSLSWGMFELGFILAEHRDRGTPIISAVLQDFGDSPVPSFVHDAVLIDGRGQRAQEVARLIAAALERVSTETLLSST
jgi:hypothetical protein